MYFYAARVMYFWSGVDTQAPLQLFVGATGEPIWKHARFPALCARLGLAQYWVETKKWPDCASETAYDFKAACGAAVAAA